MIHFVATRFIASGLGIPNANAALAQSFGKETSALPYQPDKRHDPLRSDQIYRVCFSASIGAEWQASRTRIYL